MEPLDFASKIGIPNYTYLTESLWGLNVKCSWQKYLKQMHCTNTNDYCYCIWGNEGSGKWSDLLRVPWLLIARTPALAFPLNHKDPRIFQLQHTTYHLTKPHSWRCPFIPWGCPRRARLDPAWSGTATPAVRKPIMLPSRREMGPRGAPWTLPKPCHELSDKELRWRHR